MGTCIPIYRRVERIWSDERRSASSARSSESAGYGTTWAPSRCAPVKGGEVPKPMPSAKELEATGEEEVVESEGSSVEKPAESSAPPVALEVPKVRCCESSRRSRNRARARTKSVLLQPSNSLTRSARRTYLFSAK